jgi:acetyl-CoA acetyltransferase
MRDVYVAGVGMTPFGKPGKSPSYVAMGSEAVRLALADAALPYDKIEQAYAGYVYGDSCCGHRVLYAAGMTGIPIFNVNSNCSTGSSALFMARQSIASGAVDCALVVGFEQMKPGALSEVWDDRPTPLEPFTGVAYDAYDIPRTVPIALALFAAAGREYRARHGMTPEAFADISGRITSKARRHAAQNPKAVFRDPVSVEEVIRSPVFCDPITRLTACPPTCGAAAAVLVSEPFARRHGLKTDIRIRAQAMTTDQPDTFDPPSGMNVVGFGMSQRAASRVYEEAAVDPREIKVAEVHDCFAVNELITYEALGFAEEGEAPEFARRGDNTYGGRVVINPSGGLLSKGHPLGATGLAQCNELVDQLRGRAGGRQVEGVQLAIGHNIGLGGSCVVTLYERV